MKKIERPFINLGFSSILMVFITVCLATFAALAVLTAHSDYKLSQKLADKTSAYYTADATAREIACEIEKNLFSFYDTVYHEDEYYSTMTADILTQNLSSETYHITFSQEENATFVHYQVTISDIQTLEVSLKILYPTVSSDHLIEITRWQTVTKNLHTEDDDTLHLFGTD